MRVNEDIIMRIEPVTEYSGERDATLSIELEFLHSMMESAIKDIEGAHIEGPWWEERREEPFNDAMVGVKIFGKVVFALTNGDIDIEPDGMLAEVVMSLKDIVGLMQMGG